MVIRCVIFCKFLRLSLNLEFTGKKKAYESNIYIPLKYQEEKRSNDIIWTKFYQSDEMLRNAQSKIVCKKAEPVARIIDSNDFLDKVQLPALGIHRVTIYHTHWKYLTSIFLYNSTLTVAKKSNKSGALPIISLISCSNWNLQERTWYYSLFHVKHKSQRFQVSYT